MTEAQAEIVIGLLTEIRDALLPLGVEEPTCTHPPEHRINLGSMGEDEWICGVGDCRFHYGPVKKENTHAALSE